MHHNFAQQVTSALRNRVLGSVRLDTGPWLTSTERNVLQIQVVVFILGVTYTSPYQALLEGSLGLGDSNLRNERGEWLHQIEESY